MVTVNKKELEDLLKRLEEGGTEEILTEAMGELGQYGLSVAKKNTPVGDTGILRNAWFVAEQGADKLTLRNNTEYAEYVEYGHRQTPGRYVPKLGKRLKRSWVRGVFYAAKSEETLRQNAEKVLRPAIVKRLERMLNG